MKCAVISGASGDIGKEICKTLAKCGYSIAALYNTNDASALSLKNELSAQNIFAEIFKCDLTNEDEVKKTANDIINKFGSVSLIVNNAGISKSGLITDFCANDFDNIFSANVKSMFMLNNALLPNLINQKSGAIVNIASIWGECGASCEVLYSASKAAVIGYTKALAQELAPSNIRVNCVSPGFIDTKMNREYSADDVSAFLQNVPLERCGTPLDVAKAVSFLADENSYITGQVLGVNGGFLM